VIAVLGLGEAGGEIARDLLAAGVTVRAYDPAVDAPDGAVACENEADAARGADLVLSVNRAAEAENALRSGLAGAGPATVWADLNTASPGLERSLAREAEHAGLLFADVSLMAPVPGRGVCTPMLVSGSGARRFADLMAPFGGPIEVLGLPAGEASQRKLLRSVFFKGIAAAVTEALFAARAVDLEDWMRELIAGEFNHADASFAHRLEEGSVRHAVRRADEMDAARELLTDLGVPPRIATASRDWLAELATERLARTASRTQAREPAAD
jgi:3-hydroxyisobutyrate dehydrogenase-like beta-hydroxyacid dehydrogenase